MTGICVSLVEETTDALLARMEETASVADLFEVRADLLLDLDLLTILRARSRPLLLTCRSESQGGRWADDDPGRRLALLEGVKRGFDYVDIEFSSGYLDVMKEKAGRGLVVSHHDLLGTPSDLDGLYAQMAECGADIVKIAVTPESVADVGRLLAFAERRAKRGGGPPLVPIAMGPLGTITRVITGRYGAPFTFAAAAAGAEAAPGQIEATLLADLYRVRNITAATRVYGILGQNVTRSFSPVMHNRAFEARNIDAVYVPLQAETLEAFLDALPALDLSGFSVTQPYKEEILPHLAEADEKAALCGSVNTVVVHDGLLQGSTTDGTGVLGALRKRIDIKGKKVVMVGAGGAARSAALSLVRKGARLTVLARRKEQAQELASAVGCKAGIVDDLASVTWDVLINATPIGSAAMPEATPVPAVLHQKGTIVFDMVYDPLETRLLREAQAAGCVIVDGLEMLLMQALAQFETWTGQEAPAEVMKAALVYLAQERGEA